MKRSLLAGSFSIALVAGLMVVGATPAVADTTDGPGCSSAATSVDTYVETNGLHADDTVYAVCDGSSVTVSAVTSDGQTIPPSNPSEQDSAGKPATPAKSARAQPMNQSHVGGGGADCDITGVYSTECHFSFTYQKYHGTTLVWTRGIDGYAKLYLQQVSQQVYMRFTSKNGIAINTSGSVVLQRMQGITSPTYENATNFNFTNGGTQTSGTVYVNRTTTDTGKYSIVFGVSRIFDKSEGANIPVITDPTSPRFQCYAKSQKKNCDFPNGQEAGIF